jgi:hypothetical protein
MLPSHPRLRIKYNWSTIDQFKLIRPISYQWNNHFPEIDLLGKVYPAKSIDVFYDPMDLLLLLNPAKSITWIIKQPAGSSFHPVSQLNLNSRHFSREAGNASLIPLNGSPNLDHPNGIASQKAGKLKRSIQSRYHKILKDHGFETEI